MTPLVAKSLMLLVMTSGLLYPMSLNPRSSAKMKMMFGLSWAVEVVRKQKRIKTVGDIMQMTVNVLFFNLINLSAKHSKIYNLISKEFCLCFTFSGSPTSQATWEGVLQPSPAISCIQVNCTIFKRGDSRALLKTQFFLLPQFKSKCSFVKAKRH